MVPELFPPTKIAPPADLPPRPRDRFSRKVELRIATLELVAKIAPPKAAPPFRLGDSKVTPGQ